MDISGRVNSAVRSVALWLILGVLVTAIILCGFGFLVAAFYLWIGELVHNKAVAAAITGASVVVIAIVIGVIGAIIIKKTKQKRPGILAEFSGTIGLAGRLVGMMVRRDPRKAMIVSIVAGALAEFITSDRKKR